MPYSRVAEIGLTPEEHQQVKDLVNSEKLRGIKQYDRTYLIVGEGSADGPTDRRQTVYDLLDARRSPPSTAFQLEDFGLGEQDNLWARAFDVLCGRATHIVPVLEDFDGGYVWELGLLYAPEYQSKVWVLRRRYTDDDDVNREKYDNGWPILISGSSSRASDVSSGNRRRISQRLSKGFRDLPNHPASPLTEQPCWIGRLTLA